MAVRKLYGNIVSTASKRAIVCLYEKEVDFEFVPVDMKTGQHKSKNYLSLNPFGQVPAFEDGDLKLFESRAISNYVAHEYADKGSQLFYSDSKKMAIVGVWMEVEAQQFDPSASKLLWEISYKPMFGLTTDVAVAEEMGTKLGKVFDVYEARLSESKYLAGDNFTLADLHHLPCLHLLLNSSQKGLFDSRPHVASWAVDITSRPAWKKVLAMDSQT